MVYKVEHRIGINASVDLVYDIISDLEAWPSWSPIHKSVSGRLAFGAMISLDEHYEGLGRWECAGAVADWTPLSHIHIQVPKPFWAGSLVRYFEFDALSETGSVFTAGAAFDGFLSRQEGKKYSKFLKAGFVQMGEALKAKIENQLKT